MLNLFPSVPPSTDEYTLRTQRISTRLFILSLSLSLTILIIYTAAVNIQKTVIVPNPSLEKYQQLYERYSSTLACPCTHISVKYGSFMRINYTLHQVCNSVYVSQKWNDFLSIGAWAYGLLIRTPQLFLGLRWLCVATEPYIAANGLPFYSSTYVNTFVNSELHLKAQSDLQIEQFISSITTRFRLSITLISDAIRFNALISPIMTPFLDQSTHLSQVSVPYWGSYDDWCNCDSDSSCLKNISEENHGYHRMNGFYYGCLVLESLRMSSLECLYNQTCVNDYLTEMNPDGTSQFTALSSSKTSPFFPNTTLGAILDQLMVEHWNWSVTYEDYYAACQPSECRYTLTTKNDALYIVTTLIGLIGGLVTALKIVVPELVSRIRKRRIRPRVLAGNATK